MTNTSRRVWNFILSFIRRDRKILLMALVCAGVYAGLSLVIGYVSKLLLNLMDSANVLDIHGLRRHVTPHELARLNHYSLAVVGIYAVRWVFTYGQTVYFAEVGQRLALRIRNAIYQHLQGLSLGFFNNQRTGALMSTINNDVPLLQSTVSSLKDVATAPFLILGGLVIVFRISWQLSLVAMIAVPLMALTINRLTRVIRQITSSTQDKLADVNTLMEETLSGIRVIQSFSGEGHEIRRFAQENLAAKELSMSGVRKGAQLKPTIDLIGAVGVAFALWVGGYLVIKGQLTFGDLGFFILTLNQIAVGINGLGSAKVTWEQVQAAGERILVNVLDVQSDVQDAPDAVSLAQVEGRIEFRHVAFAYNEHSPVLRDVSFTMEPGEVVAVVGPSGAGKSTIADLIPRFYDPQAGQILIGEHDLRSVTIASLRHQIGIVPQETVLFGGTIRDNIAYGNPLATQSMVEDAARAANIHDEVTQMQGGYDAIVGERGVKLSGGQRQRIAIARALLKDPRILILDEATSSLDTNSEVLVQAALDNLMQKRTTLVIAHRLSTIQNAHKILVLEAGRIVESGTHSELLSLHGLYAHLYARSQSESPAPLTAASGS